jgi:hypothetical protein
VRVVDERRTGRPDRAAALALAVTAVTAVATRGGYTQVSRGVVVLLAGAALGLSLRRRPTQTAEALRTAPPLSLVGLGALGALSASWTVAAPSNALRWALVLIALASIMGAAAAARAPRELAAILLLAAVGAAATGVAGAIGHYDRISLEVCGSWRPAGPFEYPPALALTCAAALPCAVGGMVLTTGWRSAASAGAGWLLATTVAVSGSRLEVAVAALALVAVAALLPGGARAASPGIAATLLGAGGAVSALCVGGDLGDASALALIGAGAVGVLVVAGWLPVRRWGESAGRLTWVAVVAVIGVGGVAASTLADRITGCQAGFGHGRSGIWAAGFETARERPLLGHGLESFAGASRSQQLRRRPVPVQYAHNLPLEAWVELGAPGVLLVLVLYASVGTAALRAGRSAAALLGPAAIGFLVANLLDWPWHLAGCAVLWAIAVGGLLGARAHATGRA